MQHLAANFSFCSGELDDPAPIQAAGTDGIPPRHIDDDNLPPHVPKARKFKKRGCRAGKAHKAAVSSSGSLHENTNGD